MPIKPPRNIEDQGYVRPIDVNVAGGAINVTEITGGATETKQDSLIAAIQALEQTPLTDAELRASAVPVSVSGVATAANQSSALTLLTTIAEALGGKVSSNNTTTTPLSSGATFTGTGEQVFAPDVGVVLETDNAGTLYFDFSADGTNWTTFPTNGFSVASGINEFHTAVKLPRYFRVRLINDSGAQSYLRLYTYFGTFRQGNLPLNATIGADADATVVRSVDSALDLAFGKFSGMSEDTKFGYVEGIDAADNAVTIWAFANDALSTRTDTKTFPTSAATLYAASDDSADQSLDFTADVILSDGTKSQVDFTTDASDGTTPVSLGVSGLDCNRIELTGDTQTHAGNIYIQQGGAFTSGVPDTPGDVLAFIPAGLGQTHQACDRVPSDKTRRIKEIIITVGRASGAAGSVVVQLRVKQPSKSWVVKRHWNITTAGTFIKPVAGVILSGGALIEMRLTTDVSDTDTNVTAEFAFDEVDS